MIPLNSSAIRAVGYDPSTGDLDVQFQSSGRIYTHHGVPVSLYHAFLNASSHGRFYNENLRGLYP